MIFEVPSNLHTEFLAIGPKGVDELIESCLGNSVETNTERLLADGFSRPFASWFSACVGSSRGDAEFVVSGRGQRLRNPHAGVFERYTRGYRLAATIEVLGGVVMVGAVFYVILGLWMASLPASAIGSGSMAGLAVLASLAQAIFIIVIGMVVKGFGHVVFTLLDLAVTSSPLLDAEQRIELLGQHD